MGERIFVKLFHFLICLTVVDWDVKPQSKRTKTKKKKKTNKKKKKHYLLFEFEFDCLLD